jgi:hypothetical protein
MGGMLLRSRIKEVLPFWRMGDMAVAFKNFTGPSILAYGWHGGSAVLVGPYWRMGGMAVACKDVIGSSILA